MNNIDEELQEDQAQSAIINDNAEFENSTLDPGFVSDETQEDSNDADEQGTEWF